MTGNTLNPPARPVHSGGMEVPDNLTLLPLPPGSPKLNPVEYIWQFMPEYWAGQIFVLLRVASERSLARDGCSS